MQNNPTIPVDLELVTDPKVTRLFRNDGISTMLQQSFAFMPQKQILKPKRLSYVEEMGLFARYKRKENAKVFADDGTVKPQPRCPWGNSHLARFINCYVKCFKKSPGDARTAALAKYEETARKYHILLPKLSEINKRNRIPRKRLTIEAIAINRYSDIFKLKLYNDGENIVGYIPGENKPGERELHAKTQWDTLFAELYSMLKALPENSEYNQPTEIKRRSGII